MVRKVNPIVFARSEVEKVLIRRKYGERRSVTSMVPRLILVGQKSNAVVLVLLQFLPRLPADK